MKQLPTPSPRRVLVQKSRLRPLILALCGAGYASLTLAQLGPKAIDPLQLPDVKRTINFDKEVRQVTETSAKLTLTQNQARGVVESVNQSVGSKASVEFVVPTNKSVTLWRGVGQDAAYIFGRVSSNGRLLVVNRNGIYVGDGGSVSGAAVVLSALDLDSAYTADDYKKFLNDPHVVFNTGNGYGIGPYGETILLPPSNGSPVVEVGSGATVVATDGGSVLLIGDRGVRNQSQATGQGTGGISASGGQVTLAAVPNAEVDIGDSGFIRLVSVQHNQNTGRTVMNEGDIQAPNGTVNLIASGSGNGGNVFDNDPTSLTYNIGAGRNLRQVDEGSLSSGIFNSGTIKAQGSDGGQGKVNMTATGADMVIANSGTIDVRANDARSLAGSIVASAQRVLVGKFADNKSDVAQLLADGPSGGGTITLNNLTMMANEGAVFGQIVVLSSATLSANATENGQGGAIKLSTMDGLSNAQVESGNYKGLVAAYGTFEAQGGITGGNGGRVETSGSVVSVRDADWGQASIHVAARASGYAGGLWSLYSPDITIGSLVPGGNSRLDPNATYIHADDINNVLNSGANVGMSTSYEFDTKVASGNLTIEAGTAILQSVGGGGNTLFLQSGNNLVMQEGASIKSNSGTLNVALVADADENGRGSLVLDGSRLVQTSPTPLLIDRERVLAVAQPAAVSANAPIVIATNGGRVDLVGAKDVPADGGALPINSQDGVRIGGTVVDTSGVDANGLPLRGDVFIKGAGGATGGDASTDGVPTASRNGVTIFGNSSITAGNVNIIGSSQSNAGVRLDATTITTDKGAIDIRGVSQGGTAAPGLGQPIGVDIGSGVTLNAGQGHVKILGRGIREAGATVGQLAANGVRIDGLTITTSGSAGQQITIVGQSGGSAGAGIDVVGVESANNPGAGLHVHEQGNASVASAADVIIGGSADAALAARALKLGATPELNARRVNYRPAGVSAAGEVTEAPAQAIRVGTTAGGVPTNFIVDPAWFNKAFNNKLLANPITVIGSNIHTGEISVQDGALDGAGAVTLQNQGAGAGNISLGAQNEVGLTELNLATQGNISQTGAIKAGTLSLVVGPQSRVLLNNAGNQIAALSYDSSVPQPVVSSSATPQSRAGIAGYSVDPSSPEGSAFVPLAVSYTPIVTPPPNQEPPRPVTQDVTQDDRFRPFEGADAINDLRTDVYLRGALTRMQLCTPAQTSGVQAVSVADADPLSLEWTKVRRGAQLTNCSGVQANTSCSAF